MNLIYQIPDQLYYIQNFLDRDTYKGIHNSIFKERNKINLTSSKGIWDEILIKNIIPPKRVGVSKYTPFEKLKILTKHNKFYQLKLDEINASIHYMEREQVLIGIMMLVGNMELLTIWIIDGIQIGEVSLCLQVIMVMDIFLLLEIL